LLVALRSPVLADHETYISHSQYSTRARHTAGSKISGAAKTRQASDLDRPEQQIEARARVQRYMNDPDNKKWTDEFMINFEKSNDGQKWFQARYNMGKPVKPINKEDNSNVG
jgi:hypothetical protein